MSTTIISPEADSVIREINIEAAKLRVAAANVVTVLALVGLTIAVVTGASNVINVALVVSWAIMMYPVRSRAHAKLVQALSA